MNRRTAIGASLSLVAVPTIAAGPRAFFRRHGCRIGIQLYSVNEALERDLGGTLGQLAAMGYRQVEPQSLLRYSTAEWAQALSRHGLVALSSHVPRNSDQADLTAHIDNVAATFRPLGVRTAVMAWPITPPELNQRHGEDFNDSTARLAEGMTVADWSKAARFLNEQGARLRRDGLDLAYHNHNMEFAPKGSTCGFEILLRETDPSLVSFEMDIGWVAAAGHDPERLLRRWPGRFRLMHVKNLDPTTPVNYACRISSADLGQGRLDLARVLPAAWDAGIRDFIVDQEPPFVGGRMAAARANAAFLAALHA